MNVWLYGEGEGVSMALVKAGSKRQRYVDWMKIFVQLRLLNCLTLTFMPMNGSCSRLYTC